MVKQGTTRHTALFKKEKIIITIVLITVFQKICKIPKVIPRENRPKKQSINIKPKSKNSFRHLNRHTRPLKTDSSSIEVLNNQRSITGISFFNTPLVTSTHGQPVVCKVGIVFSFTNDFWESQIFQQKIFNKHLVDHQPEFWRKFRIQFTRPPVWCCRDCPFLLQPQRWAPVGVHSSSPPSPLLHPHRFYV